MGSFTVHLDLLIITDATDDEFDQHTDDILDSLIDLDGVTDADASVSITNRAASFSVDVDAETHAEAMSATFVAVRTAIHACGGATPGWEQALELARADISPSSRGQLTSA